MIQIILQYKGLLVDTEYIDGCEKRRKRVERMLSILFTTTNGPDERFMEVLDTYIEGKITLKEMEEKVDRLEYLEV